MLSLDRVLGCVLWFWAYILVIALDHFLIFFFFLTVAVFPSRLHAELLILHFILRQSQNNITGDNGIAWFSLHISLFSCISILLVDTTFWKSCYQFKLMSENRKFHTILQTVQRVFFWRLFHSLYIESTALDLTDMW